MLNVGDISRTDFYHKIDTRNIYSICLHARMYLVRIFPSVIYIYFTDEEEVSPSPEKRTKLVKKTAKRRLEKQANDKDEEVI